MSDLDLYDYDLPRERIAQDPVATRSDARLMFVDRSTGEIDHYHVRDLPELLRVDDALVLNNTRVIPARLVGFRTKTGGRWQGLYLRSDNETGLWEVLTKTRGTLVAGETVTVQDRNGRDGMLLTIVARTDEGHLIVRPSLPPSFSEELTLHDPADWLERFGRVPLPPYIRDGQMVDADVEHYQTVYAQSRGSVAAPTAGLHFTDQLLKSIGAKGTEICEVTLHVGIGTFRPIATDNLDDHQMHEEWGQIDAETAERLCARRARGGRCVAVGTTSVRVLESACGRRGWFSQGVVRDDGLIHQTTLQVPSRRRVDDQLSPAPQFVARLGQRLCDSRTRPARLPEGNRTRISLLQLRRRDADRVARGAGVTKANSVIRGAGFTTDGRAIAPESRDNFIPDCASPDVCDPSGPSGVESFLWIAFPTVWLRHRRLPSVTAPRSVP